MTILYFIIALGLLIFVHEFGHFIIAKRAGVLVEAFSFGFGPRLFGFKRGETDYRISAFPLGGYVKMLGEDPRDEGASNPRSFAVKSVWTRARIVLFGPLMNLIFCLAIMPVVFMIGRSEPVFLKEVPVLTGVRDDSPAAVAGFERGDKIVSVDGDEVQTWEELLNKILLGPGSVLNIGVERDGLKLKRSVTVGELPELKGGYVGFEPMLFYGNEATIDGVKAGGPADRAGLKSGDKVIAFGGEKIADWIDLTLRVDKNGGNEAPVTILRNGVELSFRISPEYNKEFGRWLIGISKDRRSGVPTVVRRYGPIDAFTYGMKENLKLFGLTIDVLERLVTLKLSPKVLGGPIIIAKTSALAAASGLSDFLYFLSFLSMQLAVLNLLPIPVLDGGHLFFLSIEGVRRRPVSMRVRAVADQIGFALLIGLMLLVTYNDIDNVWGFRALFKKIF